MISLPNPPALPIASSSRVSLGFEDWFNIANCAAQRFADALSDDTNLDRAMGEAQTMSFATCQAFDEAYGELAIMAALSTLSHYYRETNA